MEQQLSVKFVHKISLPPSGACWRSEILSRIGMRRQKKCEGSGAWQEGGAESIPRMKSCSTASGESQMEIRRCSDGKRRCATKTLARLYIVNATCAVLSCISHPSQRCPVYECVELQILYSVNIIDVTNELHHLDNQDVVNECENQLFYIGFAEKRSVERCATRLVFCESSRV